MPSHFKVKEYCPLVFRNLRERFGIDDASYMKSLTRQGVLNYPDCRVFLKYYNVFDSIALDSLKLKADELEALKNWMGIALILTLQILFLEQNN